MTGDRPERMDTTGATTRRRLLAGLAGGGALGLAGCVTLSPSLDETFPDSQVFESVKASEPWSGQRIRTGITLTERATTELNVRAIAIIDKNGYQYLRPTVSGGQTSVTTYLPMGHRVTLAAVDHLDRTVERVTVETP